MPSFIDRTGQKFGRLTVIRRVPGSGTPWECRCDCGNIKIVTGGNLVANTKSCGCAARELQSQAKIKHGYNKRGQTRREYRAWNALITRCTNPKAINWHLYGGRGITVCPAWRSSFEEFLAHIGPAPTQKHEIDRIDSDGNYEPGNVRWATHKEQENNRRNNVVLEYDGLSMTQSQWSEKLGIPVPTLSNRLNLLGWTVERALSAPRRPMKRKSIS